MTSIAADVHARLSRSRAKKLIKYSAVSIIAVAVTFVVQVLCYGVLHMEASWSAVTASSVAAVPSYYLNRNWVWGGSGRSHLMREVVPFWIMVAIGLGFSTLASSLTDSWARNAGTSHILRTFLIPSASFASYGILWFLKYAVMNKILFAHHEQDLEPALDGRSGIPT